MNSNQHRQAACLIDDITALSRRLTGYPNLGWRYPKPDKEVLDAVNMQLDKILREELIHLENKQNEQCGFNPLNIVKFKYFIQTIKDNLV